MKNVADPIDRALLDDWQRGFPITARPFLRMANVLNIAEDDLLARLQRMVACGRIARVGATCAPNTISASTLAAIAAPPERIEEVAALIQDEPGINHSYLREDTWNLWFVATGPDRAYVDATLARLEQRSGLRVLDLRLVRPFNVDLGFRMNQPEAGKIPRTHRATDLSVLREDDRDILQALSVGLPLTSAPYAALGFDLGRSEDDILDRVAVLAEANIISRLGVIVRHRALGWSANAMVVWNVPADQVAIAGPRLALQPGVTLCYERTPVEGVWPYRLYSMIHAQSRLEALKHLSNAAAIPELAGVQYKALFSLRCFKQTGAMIAARPERAA
ncbi:Lrp/AsnC family transcriptional regulator [Pelagimonas sp. KU-00592-HH]|uniref:siroheme decarboxylase subunit beta n=1 Tax=Pelagimonas sp. KU-00592-HH TaxID=3127651 RepID=UPI00310BAFDA